MKKVLLFALLVAIGLVLASSCADFGDAPACCGPVATGGQPATGGSGGTGGQGGGGIGGTGCPRQEYAAPGCGSDVRPICTDGSGGACFQRVCGCNGRIETGCGLFSAPYAYVLPVDFSADGGDTCDPTADAGR